MKGTYNSHLLNSEKEREINTIIQNSCLPAVIRTNINYWSTNAERTITEQIYGITTLNAPSPVFLIKLSAIFQWAECEGTKRLTIPSITVVVVQPGAVSYPSCW